MARDLIDKLDAHHLVDDERWVAAQALTVKGTRWLRDWLAATDPMATLPNHSRRHGPDTDSRAADLGLPTGLIVAITERRVVVFGRSLLGRARSVAAEWPAHDVTLDVVDSGDRVRSRLFLLGLADGSLFAGAAGLNGAALEQSDAFVAAFHTVSLRP